MKKNLWTRTKRILAVVFASALVFGALPVSSFGGTDTARAEGTEETEAAEAQAQETAVGDAQKQETVIDSTAQTQPESGETDAADELTESESIGDAPEDSGLSGGNASIQTIAGGNEIRPIAGETSLDKEMFQVKEAESIVYTGDPILLSEVVSPAPGKDLTEARDYTLTCMMKEEGGDYTKSVEHLLDAGEYQITATAKQDSPTYKDSVTFDVTVKPCPLDPECTIKVDPESYVLGTDFNPEVTVSVNGRSLIHDQDFTYAFYDTEEDANENRPENAKEKLEEAKEYWLTVTGIKNYTGAKVQKYVANYKEATEYAPGSEIYEVTVGTGIGGYFNSDVTVSLKAEKESEYSISKDGKDGTFSQGSIQITGEGEQFFYIKETNGGAISRYSLKIDKAVPEFSEDPKIEMVDDKDVTNEWTNSKTISVPEATDAGESGLLGIYCAKNDCFSDKVKLDNTDLAGEDIESYFQNLSLTKMNVEGGKATIEITDELDEIGKTYYIYAIDNAGNIAKKTIVVTKIDSTAPVFNIEFNEADHLVNDSAPSSANDKLNSVPEAGYTAYYGRIIEEEEEKENKIEVTIHITEKDTDASKLQAKEGLTIAVAGSSDPEITWEVDSSAGADTYKGTFNIVDDGSYQISVSYQDPAGNKMVAGKTVQGSVDAEVPISSDGKYTSAKLVLDNTKPEVTFSYTDSTPLVQTWDGRDYYQGAKQLTVVVKDNNIRNQEFIDAMTKKDNVLRSALAYGIEKPDVDISADLSAYQELGALVGSDIPQPDVSGEVKYVLNLTDEANYNLDFIDYVDLAGNEATINTQSSNPHICIDTTEPELDLTYEVSDSGYQDSVNYKDHGYVFADRMLKVSASAKDQIAGLKNLQVIVTEEDGTKTYYPQTAEDKKPASNDSISVTVPLSGKDFKGSVEVVAKDWSDNSSSKIQDQIVESSDKHSSTGSAAITTLTQPSRTVDGVDFYNTDVELKLALRDSYSGLRSYAYTAGSQISETYDFGVAAGNDLAETPKDAITYEYTKNLTLAASANNRNGVPVEVSFVDNAGHTGSVSADYNIDITAPTIEVTYDNNNAASETYYKETRMATVIITERNFDPDDVRFTITNTDGTMPAISGWTSTGSGDETKHIANVTFAADGDYTFTLAFQDMAGNQADYSRVDTFTIDKTAPTYTVSYDNNDVRNGRYYDAGRTATIDILEHNFDPSAVNLSVTRDGAAVSPSISGWSKNGDHNIATVSFDTDGDYTFAFTGMDLADNPMPEYGRDEFVVDTEVPAIEIFNIENMSANNDVVRPGIRYNDTNYDANATVVEMNGYHNGEVAIDGQRSVTSNGVEVLMDDFERTQEMDDIYTMHATVYDMAGNSAEAEVTFSVNRFGSVYTFDDATDKLVGDNGSYYTNQEQDIVVYETNVDTLEFKEITRNLNGDLVTMTEDEDFTVKESGTETSWKQYEYHIDKSNFENEGTYTLTIYSEDRATNTSDNNSKGKKVEFVVDKTDPSIQISGVEDGGQYREDSREATIDVDDNIQLASVDVALNGDTLTYGADEIEGGRITLPIDSSNAWQTMSVRAYDAAGNETGNEEMRFLITSNIFIQFFAHKALFFGVVAAAAVAVAGLCWWFIFVPMKRKNDGEKQ